MAASCARGVVLVGCVLALSALLQAPGALAHTVQEGEMVQAQAQAQAQGVHLTPAQTMRYIGKCMDGVLAGLAAITLYYFGHRRCLEGLRPNYFRFFVVAEPDDAGEGGDEDEGGDKAEREAQLTFRDSLHIEVRAEDAEQVKEWGWAEELTVAETGPVAKDFVVLHMPKDKWAKAGIRNEQGYQELCDYLREIQAIQNKHKHGHADSKDFQWISEDIKWPPIRVPAYDSGYHVDSLRLHSKSPNGPSFDANYALPAFLIPNVLSCNSQGLWAFAFATFLTAVVVVLNLFL